MSAMTLTTRIANVSKMIGDVDQFLRDLRNAPRQARDAHVLGWTNWLYVRMVKGEARATNVLNATVYPTHRVTGGFVVRNGSNERAALTPYEAAIDREINRQEDLHTWLCGQYRDLMEEAAAEHEGAL